jgi:hypothetical protein
LAYDGQVAQRLRACLASVPGVVERKMFGGVAFMVDGHMSCGILGDALIVRVGKGRYAEVLKRPHTREMDLTGRPLTGFVVVAPAGFAADQALEAWVRLGMECVSSLPPKHRR